LLRRLLGSTLEEHQRLIDALSFFAAGTCDVVSPLIARVDQLEYEHGAPRTVPFRVRIKHK
jgi:hypothetical protein